MLREPHLETSLIFRFSIQPMRILGRSFIPMNVHGN